MEFINSKEQKKLLKHFKELEMFELLLLNVTICVALVKLAHAGKI